MRTPPLLQQFTSMVTRRRRPRGTQSAPPYPVARQNRNMATAASESTHSVPCQRSAPSQQIGEGTLLESRPRHLRRLQAGGGDNISSNMEHGVSIATFSRA